MRFLRLPALLCFLIAFHGMAMEQRRMPSPDKLLPLHQLYLKGASLELAKASQKMLLAASPDMLEAANILELLNADFKRSCSPVLLESPGASLHDLVASVRLREQQMAQEGRLSFVFDAMITFKQAQEKLQGRLEGLAGPAAGLNFNLRPAALRSGHVASTAFFLEKQPQALPEGLYELIVEASGEVKVRFQFFWLKNFHGSELPIITSPSAGQTLFTSHPAFRWLDFKGSVLGQCGQSQLNLMIRDPKTGRRWQNPKLGEGENPSVFGRSIGWDRMPGLANGAYQLSLKLQDQLQTDNFSIEMDYVVSQDFTVVAKGFDSCRFNFGVEWDEGEGDLSAFNYYGAWIGWNPKFPATYYRNMLLASAPGRRAQGLTPAYFAAIVEFLAVQERKLKPCREPGTDTLCFHGADFARKNRERILAVYRDYARETAAIVGSGSDMIWFIEPILSQLLLKQQRPSPLSSQEGMALLEDIYFIVKEQLPFARIVFPLPGEDVQRAQWIKAFAGRELDSIAWHYFKPGTSGIPLDSLSHGSWVDMHIGGLYSPDQDPALSLVKLNQLWSQRIRSLSLAKPDEALKQRVRSLAPHLVTDKECVEKEGNLQVKMSPIQSNKDFLLGDYRSVDTREGSACLTICEEDNHCRAWSWVNGRCYLKNVKLRAVDAVGVFSGHKILH